MEFEVLGPLRVRSEDGAPELGARAQHGLLAVLLTSPNVAISDSRLIDELWGDDPPASARHLLQVYASQLRRLLGELPDGPRIVRDGNGYALRVLPGELDAERFAAAVARAWELHELDPEGADRVLSEAMRLWRGAPFAGVRQPPAVREQAAYLERLHVEALHTWTDVRLGLGRHRELVPELASLVAEHPDDEALHAQLMLALYRCGRQAEALETARALQDRFRDDLGIELAPEVRDLYRRILLQAPELLLEPPEPPGNLPTRLNSFVGRSRELQEVIELVETSRLMTLTGPGGVGKTRLALEVAQRLRPRFPGGAWWIDLASVTDPGLVADEAARVLGLTIMPGQEVVAAVARALGRRRALLLLDNCEHVATAAAELAAAVVGGTAGPHVLATSRTPLHVEGEHLWTVPPLGLPAEEAPSTELVEFDAVHLFLERGRAVDPSFALDTGNAQAVVEICRRLDGLSLAIEMAAARLSVLTAHEIVRHLDERFALLELPTVGAPTRHRTLEAAMDASYVLLSDAERTLFERLSVFVGPFDLDAAAAVGLTDDCSSSRAVPLVAALADASLLATERDDEETRYRLLETLREYAAARLRSRGGGGEDDARCAHADYHLGLAEQAGAIVGTPEFASWMGLLTRSYAELRQALAWSLAHQDRAVTLRAAPALRELWYRRADAREVARWTALMLEGDLEAVPPRQLAEVHAAAGFAATTANDLQTARFHFETALRLFGEDEFTRGLGFALWGRCNVALALGDLDAVKQSAREALEVCEEHGDRWGRAGPLSNLGFAALFGGPPEQARAHFEEALPLYRELGDLCGLVMFTLAPLSAVALRQNDLQAAERYATEAVELAAGTGWQAAALVRYAAVLIEQDAPGAAKAAALRALRVALDAGLEIWFRQALRELARTVAGSDRYDDAALLLAASRRNAPPYALDPAIYGPLEERCRNALGDDEFGRLAAQGDAMSHDELMTIAGAVTGTTQPTR
jgi:predicted ATPase/DNA-binding SARP family transcriptional activator